MSRQLNRAYCSVKGDPFRPIDKSDPSLSYLYLKEIQYRLLFLLSRCCKICISNLIQNPTYPSNRSCLTLGLNVTDFFTTSLSFSKKKLDVLEASPIETFNKVGTRKCSTIHFINMAAKQTFLPSLLWVKIWLWAFWPEICVCQVASRQRHLFLSFYPSKFILSHRREGYANLNLKPF